VRAPTGESGREEARAERGRARRPSCVWRCNAGRSHVPCQRARSLARGRNRRSASAHSRVRHLANRPNPSPDSHSQVSAASRHSATSDCGRFSRSRDSHRARPARIAVQCATALDCATRDAGSIYGGEPSCRAGAPRASCAARRLLRRTLTGARSSSDHADVFERRRRCAASHSRPRSQTGESTPRDRTEHPHPAEGADAPPSLRALPSPLALASRDRWASVATPASERARPASVPG